MPNEPTPLSPAEVDALERRLDVWAKCGIPGLTLTIQQLLATVRDRERQRDEERHVRETAERESLHHAKRTAQLYLVRDELKYRLQTWDDTQGEKILELQRQLAECREVLRFTGNDASTWAMKCSSLERQLAEAKLECVQEAAAAELLRAYADGMTTGGSDRYREVIAESIRAEADKLERGE